MLNIEETLATWQASLCKQIDVGSLYARNSTAHKWKAPWRILLLREAVGWRLIDLLVQSTQLHKMKHVLGARILVRSAFETLGMLIYANQEMRRVVAGELDFHEFSKRTSQLLLGSRDKTTSLQSVSILTVLQRSDKRFPGLFAWYEALCESAHPNFEGMLAGYSVGNAEDFTTSFENRWDSMYGASHLGSIETCCLVFEHEYNDEWSSAFEALEQWINNNDQRLESSKPGDG